MHLCFDLFISVWTWKCFHRFTWCHSEVLNTEWHKLFTIQTITGMFICMFQLMSLVGDLMKEMQLLKEENEKLKQETKDLKASVSQFSGLN